MNERYRIESQLGAGRAGAVYAAYDTELKRPVAFRRFDTQMQRYRSEDWQTRFYDVISDLSRINHSNILSVLDAGIDEVGPYIVTTHVEGLRLSQIIKKEGKMSLANLYSLTQQCLDALQAAEEYGFYHHALCPSSIIGTEKPAGGYHFTMMDLGHSKLIPLVAGGDERALSVSMDPALMAPEIYEGHPMGIRSSLYMFGHLLYWVAVGGHPLAGLPLALAHAKHKAGEIPFLRAYRADFPEAFRRWLYWLIEPDPQNRPATTAAVIERLPSFDDATRVHEQPKPMSMDEHGLRPNYDQAQPEV